MTSPLRPPAHRGPLIASGAVVLAVGVALVEVRMEEWGAGWHGLLTGSAAALFAWLGLQGPGEGGRPRPHESVLLVTALAMVLAALIDLADVLGAEDLPAGTVTWIALAEGAAATVFARRRGSAVSTYVAALSFGVAFLAAVEWVLDPGTAAYRWMLLGLAVAFVLASLVLRGGRPRHSEMLVSAAGLAVLAIPAEALLAAFGGFFGLAAPSLPAFWELIVLAAGCGSIAYAAADRAPGPAYVGLANLGMFVLLNSGADTLEWWPLLLLAAGTVALLAGLRPAHPLPPEPDAYPTRDLPHAVRATQEGTTLRVRGE